MHIFAAVREGLKGIRFQILTWRVSYRTDLSAIRAASAAAASGTIHPCRDRGCSIAKRFPPSHLCFCDLEPVLWIHDILAWIRIRILLFS